MKKVLGYVLLFLLSGIPFGVAALGAPSRWSSVAGFSLWLVLTPLFFIGTHFVGRWTGLGSLRDLGLRPHAGWRHNLALGIAAGALEILATVGVMSAGGSFEVVGVVPGPALFVGVALAAVNFSFVAVSEELLYRGYLLQALPQRWSTGTQAALAVLIFTLSHIPMQGAYLPNVVDWVVSGMIFVIAYLTTGSLWLGIGIHFASDTLWRLLASPDAVLVHNAHGAAWVPWVPSGVALTLLVAMPLLLRFAAAQGRQARDGLPAGSVGTRLPA